MDSYSLTIVSTGIGGKGAGNDILGGNGGYRNNTTGYPATNPVQDTGSGGGGTLHTGIGGPGTAGANGIVLIRFR